LPRSAHHVPRPLSAYAAISSVSACWQQSANAEMLRRFETEKVLSFSCTQMHSCGAFTPSLASGRPWRSRGGGARGSRRLLRTRRPRSHQRIAGPSRAQRHDGPHLRVPTSRRCECKARAHSTASLPSRYQVGRQLGTLLRSPFARGPPSRRSRKHSQDALNTHRSSPPAVPSLYSKLLAVPESQLRCPQGAFWR